MLTFDSNIVGGQPDLILTPVALLPNPPLLSTNVGAVDHLDLVDTGSTAHFVSFVVGGGSQPEPQVRCTAAGNDGVMLNSNIGGDYAEVSTQARYRRFDGFFNPFTMPPTPNGTVVMLVSRADGSVVVQVNGADIPGSEWTPGPTNSAATFVEFTGYNPAGTTLDVTYGVLSLPLNITEASVTSDHRPRLAISYTNQPGAIPVGYDIQVETLNGTVLQPWSAAVVVACLMAGTAAVEGITALPAGQRGGSLVLRLRQQDLHAVTSSRPVIFPDIPRFGTNIQDAAIYFDFQGAQFRDWAQRLTFAIVGGPYEQSGDNHSQTEYQRLVDQGIADRHGRLLSWPTDATTVRLGRIDFPHPSELGDRVLRLAPGQDFSIQFADGITLVSKNLMTGEHIINFAVPPGGDPLRPSYTFWWIELDEATFVPGQTISFRKADDTTNLILRDEFVEAMSRFQVIRMMDLVEANKGGFWKSFDERLLLGWSAEAIVELLNRTGAVPYFVPGYNTPPAVFGQYMEYFEEHVSSEIPVFLFDPANEVWGGIPQLRHEFSLRGLRAGRATGDGYDTPIAAANVLDLQSGEAASGGAVGVAITAGNYVVQSIWGFSYDSVFVAKRNTDESALLPVINADHTGLIDNDDFHWVTNCDAAWMREYGAFGHDLTVAAKAASPRVRALINVQCGDAIDAGSFGRTALDYAVTEGGTDTWGSVVDGIAIAPYAYLTGDMRSTIENAAPGESRVQAFEAAFHAAFKTPTAPASNFPSIASKGMTQYFTANGRKVPPIIAVYECGMEGSSWHGTPDQYLGADLAAYFDTEELTKDLERYYDSLFSAGASIVCAYNFGPSLFPLGDNWYGPYGHFRSVDDTTSGTAKADIDTASKYKKQALEG